MVKLLPRFLLQILIRFFKVKLWWAGLSCHHEHTMPDSDQRIVGNMAAPSHSKGLPAAGQTVPENTGQGLSGQWERDTSCLWWEMVECGRTSHLHL